MIHELKTWPEYFKRIFLGDKNFEVRKTDRDFQINDILLLREFDPLTNDYTGHEISKHVFYILRGGQFGIKEGYCVMSLKNVNYGK